MNPNLNASMRKTKIYQKLTLVSPNQEYKFNAELKNVSIS